jgi:adenine/guanine phosphoribosyltransferase-like PRPP-binding protein
MTTDQRREFLKQLFLKEAFVKDAEKGYVVVQNFNLTIDPDILDLASRCWLDMYFEQDIDAVVGLPDAGSRLAPLLAEKLHTKFILPSKRIPTPPSSWQDVVTYTNSSFTTNQDEVVSHIGFVKPGMKVLLVDDVIARGYTAIAAIKALQAAGVEVVGLAVLFDKVWQEGRSRIAEETNVRVTSLVSLKEIAADGTITFAE